MLEGLKLPLGLSAAILFGVAGAHALDALALRLAAEPTGVNARVLDSDATDVIRAGKIRGVAVALSSFGRWHSLKAGALLERPVSLRSIRADGSVEISCGQARLELVGETEVMLSAPGRPFIALLERGRLAVRSPAVELRTDVPLVDVTIRGRSYDVMVDGPQGKILVIDGEVEVVRGGGKTQRFAKGHDLLITRTSLKDALAERAVSPPPPPATATATEPAPVKIAKAARKPTTRKRAPARMSSPVTATASATTSAAP